MSKITILEETIKNPITLVGKMAGVAYGSDITDNIKNYRRGLVCINDGHYRVLEFAEVYFTLEGYSNRVIRQLFRHVGDGLSAIQESTRYVDFSKELNAVIPPKIENNPKAKRLYLLEIEKIRIVINSLINEFDVPKEDAQMLIPLGATTKVSIMKNMRNLMEISRVRMCSLAYWEFRNLMNDLKVALSNYSPEWKELCDMLLKPKCEIVGYCIEKRCCGRKPYKEKKDE